MVTEVNPNRRELRRRIDYLMQDLLDLYDQKGVLEQIVYTLKLIKSDCKPRKSERRTGIGRRKVDRTSKVVRIHDLATRL